MSESQAVVGAALARDLRDARVSANLSQDDLGKAINYSSSLVSAVENGQRPPTLAYLVAVDRTLRTGGTFERLLGELTEGRDRVPSWFRDWLAIERQATLLRWFEPLLVPGLLQTEAYARAVLTRNGLLNTAESEGGIASRMERQAAVFDRPSPPIFVAILDEGVLSRPIGGAQVMAEQCRHLLSFATHHRIRIHVVPMSAGAYAGLTGPLGIATGSGFEVVHLDNALRAETVHEPEDVARAIKRWEAIRSDALPVTLSVEVIREAADRWRSPK